MNRQAFLLTSLCEDAVVEIDLCGTKEYPLGFSWLRNCAAAK
jgi:hypothetical protein